MKKTQLQSLHALPETKIIAENRPFQKQISSSNDFNQAKLAVRFRVQVSFTKSRPVSQRFHRFCV